MRLDSKLILLGFALALVLSSVGLIVDVTYSEWESPAESKLLLLASIVELCLLIGFTCSRHDGEKRHKHRSGDKGGGRAGAQSSPPDTPGSPASRDQVACWKSAGAAASAAEQSSLCLDVGPHADKQQQQHKLPVGSKPPAGAPRDACSDSSGGGLFDPRSRGGNPLPLLLVSAVCAAVAGNVNIYLLNLVSCYAWAQLALLQVVTMAIIYSAFSSSRSCRSSRCKLKVTFNTTGRMALGVLFLTVCVGQGVLGGGTAIPIPEDEEASMLPAGARSAPAVVLPRHVLAAAWLAAIASAVAALLLDLAQQVAPRQTRESPQVYCIWRCVLYVLCNALCFLVKEGDGFWDGFWDDLMAPHWHAVLLLGVAGLLVSSLSCWPATDALLARGYAYQGAVVLSAWGSDLVLGASQGTLFACSSLLGGSALLLLHNSMQRKGARVGRGQEDGSTHDPLGAALQGALKSGRVSPQLVRTVLSHLWAVTTVVLLVVTGWVQLQHTIAEHASFGFSHPASAHAMASVGITPQLLSACSDAPFPATVLYGSTRLPAVFSINANGSAAAAAAAGGTHGTAAGSRPAAKAGQAAAAVQPAAVQPAALAAAAPPLSTATAAAWGLCPAWSCSTDPTCSPRNTSCCTHLMLHMVAFWDAFMHSHGLGAQHTVLYDTLMDPLLTATLSAATDALHVGVSAQALVALERPCLKQKLWQHGYALFLQGNTWRLCAHAQHPLPVFRQHMHPVRHLTPAAGDHMQLHVMWARHRFPKQDASTGLAEQQRPQRPTPPLPGRMSPSISSLWGRSALLQETIWQVCSTGEILLTGPGHTVSMDGLHLPRPIDAQQHLAQLSSSRPQLAAAAGKSQLSPAQHATAQGSSKASLGCATMIAELVAHMPA